MLSDGHLRKIEYLRLSVTDLCDLRCRYCMPLCGAAKQDRKGILTYEEMARLVAIFVDLGIRSVRITGGEPLVRKGLPTLIAMLRKIRGLEDVLLTTNGFHLLQLAPQLKEAGLERINIHLDTLDPERYRHMTHGGEIDDVIAGIDAAQAAGLTPIKINSVLMKDYQDVEAMTYFAAERNLIIRFIELMPIGPGKAMSDRFLAANTVLEQLSQRWTLIPFGKRLGPGPADYYKIVELNSIVGLIHAVSEPFCSKCNRIRLAADGRIQDCLAYDDSICLRTLLRTPGVGDEKIASMVRQIIGLKREDHGGFQLPQYKVTCGMYGIGG